MTDNLKAVKVTGAEGPEAKRQFSRMLDILIRIGQKLEKGKRDDRKKGPTTATIGTDGRDHGESQSGKAG
jgi:hypothetical protein